MSAKPQVTGRRLSDTAQACETLKRAIIGRDAQLAGSVYADDVELVIINRNYPPSQPLLRHGKAAALELWSDICSKENDPWHHGNRHRG
jgi:hypothetical protein